jgi:hypothetical protein
VFLSWFLVLLVPPVVRGEGKHMQLKLMLIPEWILAR